MSFDLDSLIADLVTAGGDSAPLSAVGEVLARALARPADIADVLGFRINLGSLVLHRSDELTIQRFISPPHYATGVHDHRMWAVVAAFGGREDNTFYRRSESGISRSGGRTVEPGDVVVLDEEAIHEVNSGELPVGAIHVYGGNLWATQRSQWSGDPLAEHAMELEADLERFVNAAREAGLLD